MDGRQTQADRGWVPWQKRAADRGGSFRRGLIDHVILFSQSYLHNLVDSWLSWHSTDRLQSLVKKGSPAIRPVTPKRTPTVKLVYLPGVGGLQHKYEWREAA